MFVISNRTIYNFYNLQLPILIINMLIIAVVTCILTMLKSKIFIVVVVWILGAAISAIIVVAIVNILLITIVSVIIVLILLFTTC